MSHQEKRAGWSGRKQTGGHLSDKSHSGGSGTPQCLRAFLGCLLHKSAWEDLAGLQQQVWIHQHLDGTRIGALHRKGTSWHVPNPLHVSKQHVASGDEPGTPFNTRLLLQTNLGGRQSPWQCEEHKVCCSTAAYWQKAQKKPNIRNFSA